jgi:hypothetical protein
MKKFWIVLSVCWLWTCSGGSDKATGPEEPPIVINLTSLGGQAQKGPFNNGTSINVAELSNTLSPTGRNFSSAITDNTGRFAVANVQLESPYVELRATGFYFNEVANEISDAQLTLFALSNLTGKTSLNVNILTHLEKNRMVTLMSGENPKTFAQAKLQAQEEVLAIFDYSRANVPESELLDISQDGAANAKLLAMSAIIQGDLTVGQMSQLLANISTDIASDGTLDDTNLRNTLIENSKNLDMAEVRSNIVAHYTSLGISATIPDFETEINQFLKPPVAQDMSVSTAEDTPINITLDASDPEGESLTFQIVETNNATVNINGNVANYTPDANFNGTDTFTYFANDGTVNSNTATVTITVGAVDDEPNTNDVATTTDEDTEVVFTLTADEYDGDSYSFALITQPSNGTASLDGSTVTYTPNQDFNGEDTFTFEATDDTGRTINVATATITVNPVNDAPTANDVTTSTDENLFSRKNTKIDITYDADNDILFNNNIKGTSSFDSSNSVNITLDGTDVDGDALTYSISSASNGTLSLNNDIVTYVPNQDWNGEDTFTYVANDGSLDSNTATVTITVNSVNDAPTVNDITLTGDEDTSEIVDLSTQTSDIDGDALTYSIITDVTNGTTSIDGSKVTYTPDTNWSGTDSYTYKANDGSLDSNTATVTITVNPVNDAPTTTDIAITMNENRSARMIGIELQGSDVDGDDLTYSVVSDASNGSTDPISSGYLHYFPNDDWNGTETITYKANDGLLDSNTSTITVTVTSVNDAPVTTDISATTNEDTSLLIHFEDGVNIIDIDNEIAQGGVTGSIVNLPTNGKLYKWNGDDSTPDTIILTAGDQLENSAGLIKAWYVPNSNFNGTDTFTYKANDGSLDSNTSTVTITVNAVNDAPVAENNSFDAKIGITKEIVLTGSDVDSDNLSYSIVNQPLLGQLSLNGNTVSYDASSYGEDSFSFQISDGDLLSNTAEIELQNLTSYTMYEYRNSYGESAIEANDGGFITVGYAEPGRHLLKVDQNGVFEFRRFYLSSNPVYLYDIKSDPSGGYILSGSSESGPSIIKVDDFGNMEWENSVGSEWNYELMRSSVVLDSGDYVSTGYITEFGLNAKSIVLLKTDQQGNTVWSKTHWVSNTRNDIPFDLISTSDGGFAIIGITQKFGLNRVLVVKTDSEGNQEWLKDFDLTPNHDTGRAIFQTSDEGFIFLASGGSESSNAAPWVVKIDKNGEKEWENAVSIPYDYFYLTDAIQLSDGGFMCVGYGDTKANGHSGAVVAKLDQSGNREWIKSFTSGGWDPALSISQSSQGTFIISGLSRYVKNNDTYMYLLHIDDDGNILF